MSKAPSDATQLRNVKAELRRIILALRETEKLRKGYSERATKYEQECAEWKARFDILLRREKGKP